MSFKNRAEIKLAQIDVKYILQFFNEEETLFTFWCMTKNWIKILEIAAASPKIEWHRCSTLYSDLKK